LGKAYLSSLPHDQLTQKLNQLELPTKTPNTIVNRKELFKQLQDVKEQGYSINNEEYLPGLISIGAPLIDPVQQKGVGAVSFDFSILQHSLDEVKEKYGNLIIETGKRLSELLPPDNKKR
jgi:DNA-binding IclR family transcriptional regulator